MCGQLTHRSTGANDFAMVELSEQAIIAEVIERLTRRYPLLPAETVTEIVRQNYTKFDGRPIRDYVPLFVERGAQQELALLGG
jgi:hypothetical protein